jgi:DNA-binding CsgD family transcriptional regulator
MRVNQELGSFSSSQSAAVLNPWKDLIQQVSLQKTADESLKKTQGLKRYFLKGDYEGIYLTQRERDVLIYLLKGYSLKELARHEAISLRTVEDHTAHIRRKLGFSRKQEMIRVLLEKNYGAFLA